MSDGRATTPRSTRTPTRTTGRPLSADRGLLRLVAERLAHQLRSRLILSRHVMLAHHEMSGSPEIEAAIGR
jgi:hypothetical protein